MPKTKYCDCVSTIPSTVKIGYKNYKLENEKIFTSNFDIITYIDVLAYNAVFSKF